MKSDRIAVRETHPVVNLLLTFLLIPSVAVGSAIAAVSILRRLQPLDPNIVILVFVGIGVCPTAIVAWLVSLGSKAMATPVLHVDGTVPAVDTGAAGSEESQAVLATHSETPFRVAALRKAAGVVLPQPPEGPVCVKFTVCEEGIVLYRSGRANLVRWGRIRDLKADRENQRFEFTLNRFLGKDSFSAPDRFDEVKRMLSQHLDVG